MGYQPRRLLCLRCGEESDATGDLRGCPSCDDEEHVPADLNDAVTVTLTRHELRILTIWASNWAEQCGTPEPTRIICDRLGTQVDAALTMSQEFADLRAAFGSDNVKEARERVSRDPALLGGEGEPHLRA